MTEKQKLFADEYLIDLNATRAYKAAYPKVKKDETAAAAAARALRNVNVAAYVAERMKKRQERTEITQDMVIQELAAIAFSKTTDYAKVVEKEAVTEDGGPVLDAEGNPVTYRTVELELTDALSEKQKSALAVIKKGRDGYEVKTHDKIKALELLGKHFGMFGKDAVDNSSALEKLDSVLCKIGGVI